MLGYADVTFLRICSHSGHLSRHPRVCRRVFAILFWLTDGLRNASLDLEMFPALFFYSKHHKRQRYTKAQ